MSIVKVRFEVANEVQFSRAFENFSSRIADLTEPFREIQLEFYDTMANVFAAEGAFEDRTKWAELSPNYRAWKQRKFPGRKILELTGKLKSSLITSGSEGNVSVVTPTEMSVGTTIPYAIYHQKGTSRMPMRKIIHLTQEQKLRWVHIIHKYLYGLSAQAADDTRKKI